jgi:hypothetical protein
VDITDDPAPPPAGPRLGRFALLVGVTKYDHGYKALHGPSNDVRLFRRVLIDTFRFPASNITTLDEESNRKPTRANIQRAFEDLAQQAREGDQVAILLSGHGSEQPDQVPPDPNDPEPNGMDQVFLPADAGRPDLKRKVIPNGIIDDELRIWLKVITDKGVRVFLVADCCHSGTLLRGETEEGVRGIPAEQLWPIEVRREALMHATAARGAGHSAVMLPSPFKLEKKAALVALYACQPDQKTYEFPLPDRDGRKHGLLTWTICGLLSRAGSPLTYRELAKQAHESIIQHYEESALAREKMPIPFAEGDDLDREVLGEKRWPGRSNIVFRRGEKPTITGGKLHGLYPGTILAVYPPAGDQSPDRLLGHVRIRASEMFTASAELCPYGSVPSPAELPDNSRVRPVYLAHDLKRLRIFLGDVADADRRLLRALLVKWAAGPNAFLSLEPKPEQANWAIRAAKGKLWLLPAAADVEAESSSRFELPREDLGETLRARLEQIARAQNLLSVASMCARETGQDDRMKVDVEIRRLRDDKDTEGVVVSNGPRALQLRSGEWILYRAYNRGNTPVDVTLLAVFGDCSIHSFFPEKGSQIDNRILPGKHAQTDPLRMHSETLGLEHLVMIAVDGTGKQQVDFACLAEGAWETARGARTRGSDPQPVMQTPLGKLFAHALFRRGQTRGTRTADRYQMRVLSWQALPGEGR